MKSSYTENPVSTGPFFKISTLIEVGFLNPFVDNGLILYFFNGDPSTHYFTHDGGVPLPALYGKHESATIPLYSKNHQAKVKTPPLHP